MTSTATASIKPIYWEDGKVRLIDQTRLPLEEVWLEFDNYRDVIRAIKEMRVRGAPAIGLAGAYALALAAKEMMRSESGSLASGLDVAALEIKAARPTGANLQWAVDRMQAVSKGVGPGENPVTALITEAISIQAEDEEGNRRIGELGASLIPHGSAVLTHCNAGALATGGYGTALGIVRTAWAIGRVSEVFATETRPLLQGARLTAWELARDGINVTLIADSAAGQLLSSGRVQAVVVGADRVAASGDAANKIGTYSLAVLAAENKVPFYVAAPTSTVDIFVSSGKDIPIEERAPEEVTHVEGSRVAADGVRVLNPAFDVTPGRYVTAIVTERGVVREPYRPGLKKLMENVDG